MRKNFEEQLEKSEKLDEHKLSQLKGKSIYSDYKVGDKILWFFELEKTGENTASITVRSVCEREFEKLEKDFAFVEMKRSFPLLERRS